MAEKNKRRPLINKKHLLGITLVLAVFVLFFVVPLGYFNGGVDFAQAEQAKDAISNPKVQSGVNIILGNFAMMVASFFGKILSFFVGILVYIAKFQDFTKVSAVVTGWGVVRDICNMFFILILLVIAFATILRLESYSAKRLLPKLLIMAVVINFSKLIAGLIIDFGQVIMLTFIDGLGNNASGVFIDRLKAHETLSFDPGKGAITKETAIDLQKTVLTLLGGIMVLLVSLVVIVILMIVLLFRVAMLWILVILSPLAFMATVLPSTAKYAQQWWQEFIKWVTVGPMVAFFVWLALVGLRDSSGNVDVKTLQGGVPTPSGEQISATNNEVLTENEFLPYIITVALLMGGLAAAQQAGGLAGSAAGNAMGRIKRAGSAPIRGTVNLGKKVPGSVGTFLAGGEDGSRRAGFRENLTKAGASKFPVVNRMATKTLSSLGKKQREKAEDAKKYVSNIPDQRIRERIANSKPKTAWGKAVKQATLDSSPSLLSRTDAESRVAKMDKKKFSDIGFKEIAELGRKGVRIDGEALEHLESNKTARRAYNEGAMVGGHGANYVTSLDKNGLQTTDYGFQTPGPPVPGAATRYVRGRSGVDANAYRKVEGDEANAARGNGGLSVTHDRFLNGKSNTVAFDFDKLDMRELKDHDDEEYRNIKGVNVDSSDTIKKVADKMVSAIDSELKTIQSRRSAIEGKSNANITLNDQKELQRLERQEAKLSTAKDRFTDPESMKNLRLVNSSAHGYKGANDVKKTMIHEEIHDKVRNEADTEKLTQYVIDNKKYSKTEDLAREYASSGKTVDEFIADHAKREGWQAPERKSVDEVIAAEENDAIQGTADQKASVPENVKNSALAVASASNNKSLVAAIGAMVKATKEMAAKSGEGMSKIANGLSEIGDIDTKSATSLELDVTKKQAKKEVEKLIGEK